jgi:hypothetical protein
METLVILLLVGELINLSLGLPLELFVLLWFACGLVGFGLSMPLSFRFDPATAADRYEDMWSNSRMLVLLGMYTLYHALKEADDCGYSGFIVCIDTARRKAQAIQKLTAVHGRNYVYQHWLELLHRA